MTVFNMKVTESKSYKALLSAKHIWREQDLMVTVFVEK